MIVLFSVVPAAIWRNFTVPTDVLKISGCKAVSGLRILT